MKKPLRHVVLCLAALVPPVAAPAEEVLGPDQQVYINQRGYVCVAAQVLEGAPEAVGKWRVRYRMATQTGPAGTFLALLNATRARHGLRAVGYDAALEGQAAVNNAHQLARGMGHFFLGSARRQNSAVGQDAAQVHAIWMNSGPHRAAMLDPSIRAIGLAQSGQWWTLNAY